MIKRSYMLREALAVDVVGELDEDVASFVEFGDEDVGGEQTF